jgi:hypothetical protein
MKKWKIIMYKKYLLSILVLFLLLIATNMQFAYSADDEPPLSIWSLRALSMGGTGICCSNDMDALIYNPACLEALKGNDMALNVPVLGVNSDIFNSLQDIYKAYTDSGETGLVSAALDFLLTPDELSIAPRACPSLGLVTPMLPIKLGIGVYGGIDTSIGKEWDILVPKYTLNATVDGVGIVGVARKFEIGDTIFLPEGVKPNTLSLGMNLKYVAARFKINSTIGIDNLFSLLTETNPDYMSLFTYQRGSGIGFDGGLLFSFNNNTMSAGLSLTDIGGTAINYDPDPATIPMGIHTGFAWRPSKLVTFEMDLRNIASGGDFLMKTHFGAEYNLGQLTKVTGLHQVLSSITLRGGFNSGYETCGLKVSLDLVIIRANIEAMYYQEEIGDYASNISRDLWIISVTAGLF